MFNENVLNVKPSATAELMTKMADYKRKGIDVISLNVGEPDFDTPAHISQAGIEAIQNGSTRYAPVAGIHELRQAVCTKLKLENSIIYNPENIIVTVGAKQAVFNTLLALCNPGDEVIILTPCWVSYIEMVTLTGATPVLVETLEDKGFQLNLEQIRKAFNARTKAIIFNTPNNPTGAVYTRDSLEELASLAVEHNTYVIADEIYEKLIYEDAVHHSIASFNDAIKKLTITINGFSKAYAMTGWRVGYVAAEMEIIKLLTKIQGHSTSSTSTISQEAAVAALEGPQRPTEEMILAYDERRKYLHQRLSAMKNISCTKVTGAFYLVPNVSAYYGKTAGNSFINDSVDLATYLLEEAKVAVVPGNAFEMPNNVRIAYSNSMLNLTEGMDRMEQALEKIK